MILLICLWFVGCFYLLFIVLYLFYTDVVTYLFCCRFIYFFIDFIGFYIFTVPALNPVNPGSNFEVLLSGWLAAWLAGRQACRHAGVHASMHPCTHAPMRAGRAPGWPKRLHGQGGGGGGRRLYLTPPIDFIFIF